MNWTGGSLQRTKHANKGVVQKQKAYFARARTELQNPGSPTAPFRPDYFREAGNREVDQRLPSSRSASTRRIGHGARFWRKADPRDAPVASSKHPRQLQHTSVDSEPRLSNVEGGE
jgi:hypothetical protein